MGQRRALGPEDYVFPEKAPGPGSYPIPDRGHAEAALRDCAKDGPEVCARVREVVGRRFGIHV
jgi:hypothetical protein